jgi:hypothetical protein
MDSGARYVNRGYHGSWVGKCKQRLLYCIIVCYVLYMNTGVTIDPGYACKHGLPDVLRSQWIGLCMQTVVTIL